MIDLRKRALENPEKPAYIMGESNEVITKLQLEERANQCSHLFRDLGLGIGDHIAIFMENNRYFLEICLAAGRSGLIYTPISTYLKVSEIEYIVNNSGAQAFITSKAMYDTTPLTIDLMPNVVSRLMIGAAVDGFESYEDMLAGYPKTPIEDQMGGQDMLYSSGTTGRPKAVKMIISGGVNIYPREAENVLIMHPTVMDAAVLGVPNEEFGEEVKGVVQPRDMSTVGPELEQELMTYCRSKLSKIKCPVSIDFEAELPRTATGKLLKRLLKKRYWGTERKI
jgi:acyl-CoA synthetase (AMP-forming)/AMP-acid ligase II